MTKKIEFLRLRGKKLYHCSICNLTISQKVYMMFHLTSVHKEKGNFIGTNQDNIESYYPKNMFPMIHRILEAIKEQTGQFRCRRYS